MFFADSAHGDGTHSQWVRDPAFQGKLFPLTEFYAQVAGRVTIKDYIANAVHRATAGGLPRYRGRTRADSCARGRLRFEPSALTLLRRYYHRVEVRSVPISRYSLST